MKRFYIDENIKNFSPNYIATICKVGEIHPIEGADKISRTVVNGFDIVVGNNTKEGDIVVYVPVESAINEKFLSANNLYEIGEWERNSNCEEVGTLLAKVEELKSEGKFDEAGAVQKEAKALVGYFNKRNRVRIVTLKGIASNGFIASIDSLVKYDPELKDTDWESLVGTQFNTIGEEEFCHKYIPPVKEIPEKNTQKRFSKRMKKIKRFDRLIDGFFKFHYDTIRIDSTNFSKALKPDNIVTLSVKVHGSSVVCGNVLVNRKLSFWEKIKKLFGAKVQLTEYGNVYSSRSVIKNRYINNGTINNFYGYDIWGCVNRDFSPYLDEGMTVYGEIVGYAEGSDKMIQKDHDYGCEVGHWKFMPYRITITDKFGDVKEWNLTDVDAWTRKLVAEHPELEEKVLFLDILYHGKFSDLYKDIPVDENWHDNVLERLKNDKNFYMELKEPMCHLYEKEANAAKLVLEKAKEEKQSKKTIAKLQSDYEKWEAKRAPREGIVIRIDDDPKAEAWKIKTNAHYNREALQHDADEVDIEETA